MIWGSIVVFGAYDSWSYDESHKYKNDDKYSYCPCIPFMTAFKELNEHDIELVLSHYSIDN